MGGMTALLIIAAAWTLLAPLADYLGERNE